MSYNRAMPTDPGVLSSASVISVKPTERLGETRARRQPHHADPAGSRVHHPRGRQALMSSGCTARAGARGRRSSRLRGPLPASWSAAGMGCTLRANWTFCLQTLRRHRRVIRRVVEWTADAWSAGHHPLRDPRVQCRGDVREPFASGAPFDAILLDVDNGRMPSPPQPTRRFMATRPRGSAAGAAPRGSSRLVGGGPKFEQRLNTPASPSRGARARPPEGRAAAHLFSGWFECALARDRFVCVRGVFSCVSSVFVCGPVSLCFPVAGVSSVAVPVAQTRLARRVFLKIIPTSEGEGCRKPAVLLTRP